jgi:hypothetical protein
VSEVVLRCLTSGGEGTHARSRYPTRWNHYFAVSVPRDSRASGFLPEMPVATVAIGPRLSPDIREPRQTCKSVQCHVRSSSARRVPVSLMRLVLVPIAQPLALIRSIRSVIAMKVKGITSAPKRRITFRRICGVSLRRSTA